MIIDAHNHPDWYGFSVEKVLQNMEKYNIDKTWMLSWEAPEDEYDPQYRSKVPDSGAEGPISFRRCAEYVRQYPERFILGYAPDPRRPDAIARLQAAIDLYDVRVYGELKLRMMYDNPDAIRMFRFCGEHGLPVIVHLDYPYPTGKSYPRPDWWYGGGIDAFERAVAACPETNFLGHAPGFWAHLSGDDQYKTIPYPQGPVLPNGKVVEMMRKYPNLYCEISAGSGHRALSRDLAFTTDFLTEFQDRVVYGRDYFDNVHQELLESLELPAQVLSKIYSENALRLVPLRA